MIPPSSWDSASVGFTMRPASCTATMRTTRTAPVSVSTSTSANWAPVVTIPVPVGFGPREPCPMIITLPSFAVTSPKASDRSESRTCTRPSRVSSASTATSSSPAAASRSPRRASSAAIRTAGVSEATVMEPHEFPLNGPVAVSPMIARTASSRWPSASAATCARMVRVPVPRSCVPESTSAVPSVLRRTVA